MQVCSNLYEMTSDLSEKVLEYLDKYGNIDTLDLAEYLHVDHQKVVGAVKSLQAAGDFITVEQQVHKKWELTEEGMSVVDKGSHEAVVYNAVPAEGIAQSVIMQTVPNAKVGLSKAVSSGWITITKNAGQPFVTRRVEGVKDVVREHLQLIVGKSPSEVTDTQKQEYKKRKLLQEVVTKSFLLGKGKDFGTSVEKMETELTQEMIANGSWKGRNFKSYNLDSLGISPERGHLHTLLKVRDQFRQIFLEMGFSEMPTNNFVESSFWNFDALYQPQQHPARDAHDTFFISEPKLSTQFPSDYVERVKWVHSVGGYGSQGYGYEWQD